MLVVEDDHAAFRRDVRSLRPVGCDQARMTVIPGVSDQGLDGVGEHGVTSGFDRYRLWLGRLAAGSCTVNQCFRASTRKPTMVCSPNALAASSRCRPSISTK